MRLTRYAVLSLLAFLLYGCGPMYQTQYSYVPPPSKSGKMCVMNCEMSRTNCMQAGQLQDQNCQYRADLEYQLCLSRNNNDTSKCFKSWCGSGDAEAKQDCVDSYNRCFQNCGGELTSQQVCVAFCK